MMPQWPDRAADFHHRYCQIASVWVIVVSFRSERPSTMRPGQIGLGGTGSCILDFISRTRLAQISLFDHDKVRVHTIFRLSGFIPRASASVTCCRSVASSHQVVAPETAPALCGR